MISKLKNLFRKGPRTPGTRKPRKQFNAFRVAAHHDNDRNNTQRAWGQTEDEGHIYLLQLREFIKTKENVFKIGRTVQMRARLGCSQYKQARVEATFYCKDVNKVEKNIISSFDGKFIQRDDIGREYYEGTPHEIRTQFALFMKQIIDDQKLTRT